MERRPTNELDLEEFSQLTYSVQLMTPLKSLIISRLAWKSPHGQLYETLKSMNIPENLSADATKA
jgi:hypothetical protein